MSKIEIEKLKEKYRYNYGIEQNLDIQTLLQELERKDKMLEKMKSKVDILTGRLLNATHFQNQAKNFLEHHDNCNIEDYDMPEDEACMCGLDAFAHDNHISLTISNETLIEIQEEK